MFSRSATVALALAVGQLSAGGARANPRGGTVAGGGATISEAGALMTIEQSADRAIINWHSFSSAAGETVRFRQPAATSAILNRVTGSESTVIDGALEANGRVFLINPNGVLFGTTATVDTGGLVASTLTLSDDDFRAATQRLAQDPSKPLRSVVNQGRITSSGPVVLVAPFVFNQTPIAAPALRAALAAGTTAVVALDEQGLVSLGVRVSPLPRNVLVPQRAVRGVFPLAVNNAQLFDASHAVVTLDGDVELRGAEGTVINVGGPQAPQAPGRPLASSALLASFPALAAFPALARAPALLNSPIIQVLLSLRGTLQGQGNPSVAVGGLGRVSAGVRAFFRPNVALKVNPVTIGPMLAAQLEGVSSREAAGPAAVKAALEANRVLPPGMTLEDLREHVLRHGTLPPGVDPLSLKAALEALGLLPPGLSLEQFREALRTLSGAAARRGAP